MIRVSKKALFFAMGVYLLWMPASSSVGDELIEPTRGLKGETQQPGRLSVFSEPPGLGVTLDGKLIGKTPLGLESLNPGTHVLRVGDKETMLTIAPGQVRRLSFFKDAVVEMPVEENVSREAPQAAEKQPVHTSDSEPPTEKSQNLEPGYFPLDPGGRIY